MQRANRSTLVSLSLGLGLLTASCSSEEPGGAMEDNSLTQPVNGAAGQGGSAGSAGAPAAGEGGAGGQATAGAGGGEAGAGGGEAGAGGGEAGSGGGNAPFPACEGGSIEPCGSYTTARGSTVELGAYGVVMDRNVGQGFEVAINAGDQPGSASCALFAGTFAEDPDQTATLLDISELEMDLFTVYRPAQPPEGEKLPLITWGNGTCAQPEGYGALLRYVASQGFVVVAANSRWVGSNGAMALGLDFMFAANDDADSPYYQMIDTDKVGAMGHSQGSAATAAVASDPRIKTVILFNGGNSADKPFLAVSGDYDIGNVTAASLASGVNGVDQAAFMFYHMVPMTGSLSGHLTLMTEPNRVTEPTTAWFKYMLLGDETARTQFVGDDCGLCGRDEEFEYGHKGLN